MEYRRLGNSGLRVSSICLGTMMFGLRTTPAVAGRIMDKARSAGANFLDTADVYSKGKSEEIVGRLIGKDRDDWVLATKVAANWSARPNESGAGRKWLVQELDASLKRLKTDYIDLYYLHKDDSGTPIEETVGALGDAIRAGKIRYWGLSNFASWRAAQACETADRMGVPRPIASQPYYNAMNRMPEVEHLPACAAYGLGIVPYSPVARGVLTGKYPVDGPPPKGTRAGHADKRMMESEYRRESLEIAQIVRDHAERRGMTAAQFATLWVLNNRLITAVIAGPRTMAQWTEYLGALNHEFTAEDEALIDSLVPPGHPSTPGYTDPNHPVIGRPVHSR
ncbi:MAG: aldo/keto reductase [Rhodospirillaceae bacterium]|jgi:aryl-alcohol dehydrogenase-like predicted oxidoreductase|nr:aldo/keto reductase [Rhodospirillaceae bacterium]MBT6116437.1 aldo/keto reductase [Rhodospirillaceae bacterium]